MSECKLSKGDITKNKIIEYAKESFYKEGYRKTTITNLCKKIDISLGNFTYYFKTKDCIITQIAIDYLASINQFIEDKIDPNEKFFYKHFIVSVIYYKNILEDKCCRRFYFELLEKKPLYKVMPTVIEYTYDRFMMDFDITMTPMQKKMTMAADLGSRREIILGYLRGEFKMPVEDLVIAILMNTGRLVGLPEIEMYKMSYLGYIAVKDLTYDHLKYLI